MSYLTEHRQKFDDLKHHLNNVEQIRREANGGNSILFAFPPEEESEYIYKVKELYISKAGFIDVSELLVKFIDSFEWSEFEKYYKDYRITPHVIFKSDDPSGDLFSSIIKAIETVASQGKIPILIRTGALYGTGIENIHIMEHSSIMSLLYPLVIFYPSKIKDENLFFLNFRLASRYRCTLIK